MRIEKGGIREEGKSSGEDKVLALDILTSHLG